MDKKRLLKSILGTLGIYLLLVAFLFIFSNFLDSLVYYWVYCGVLIACSITAGLLFKGQIYPWVWSAATVIFFVVFLGPAILEGFFIGVIFILLPLLIPFFIVKFWVFAWSQEMEQPREDPPRNAFKSALDDSKEKQNEEIS